MATYLDVTSLVGVKINSSGMLGTGNSLTVPAGGYALITYINTNFTLTNTDKLPGTMVVGAGQTVAVSAGGQLTISGVNVGYTTGSTCHYVTFVNNQ